VYHEQGIVVAFSLQVKGLYRKIHTPSSATLPNQLPLSGTVLTTTRKMYEHQTH